jgi:PLP dependent protein
LSFQLSELSMGMSGDYLPAIAAGATMIRPGSIIFKHNA